MQHYYTNDPDLAHDERTFDFELGGHRLRFTTDNGVFSKHTLDLVTTKPCLMGRFLMLALAMGQSGWHWQSIFRTGK